MDTDLKRRLVSVEQLHTLLDFMKEHPELARGLSRGRRGKLMTVKVWNACAKKLNSMKNGAVKDGKGWSKYWCDWKYRVRRHALELRVARDTNRTPPEGITPLSPIEEKIMSIIKDSSLDSVVVKSDPLVDENYREDQEINDNVVITELYETRAGNAKRRRSSPAAITNHNYEHDDDDDDPRDSPPQQRARLDNPEESDSEEEESSTRKFLRLEKMQMENSKKIQESICQMSSDLRKLTDIMGEIRDVLVKRLNDVT